MLCTLIDSTRLFGMVVCQTLLPVLFVRVPFARHNAVQVPVVRLRAAYIAYIL